MQFLQVRLDAGWGQREGGGAGAAGFADVRREPAARAVTEDHLLSAKLAEKNTWIKAFSY